MDSTRQLRRVLASTVAAMVAVLVFLLNYYGHFPWSWTVMLGGVVALCVGVAVLTIANSPAAITSTWQFATSSIQIVLVGGLFLVLAGLLAEVDERQMVFSELRALAVSQPTEVFGYAGKSTASRPEDNVVGTSRTPVDEQGNDAVIGTPTDKNEFAAEETSVDRSASMKALASKAENQTNREVYTDDLLNCTRSPRESWGRCRAMAGSDSRLATFLLSMATFADSNGQYSPQRVKRSFDELANGREVDLEYLDGGESEAVGLFLLIPSNWSTTRQLAIALVLSGLLGAMYASWRGGLEPQLPTPRTRPLLVGASTGYLIFLAIRGGQYALFLSTQSSGLAVNPYGAAATAFIAATFAERTYEVLTAVVDDVVRRMRGAFAPPPPPVPSLLPGQGASEARPPAPDTEPDSDIQAAPAKTLIQLDDAREATTTHGTGSAPAE